MMSYGYKPELSEGAIKSPIFQTSTFVFRTAEAGKAFFEVAYGLREPGKGEELGLIYSRINNPDLEILENRLRLWDEAEDCAVFESGMAAITTVLLEFLKPGDLLLHSCPVYGGTEHFIEKILVQFGIHFVAFYPADSRGDIVRKLHASGHADKLAMIFLETPANPTNAVIDMDMCRSIADEFSTPAKRVYMAVDNTYMGPLWQHPLKFGADLVLYSATKYIGGHSDVIAGACLGSSTLMKRVKTLRTFLGNMAAPWTGWLLLRSLETMKVRMECQAANAIKVAEFLHHHQKVERVYYLGLIPEYDSQYAVYKRQCSSPGAMISFDIRGGEKEAFTFLNSLRLIRLAVSLGGTESLAEHPATMTHIDVPPAERAIMSVSERLIRLSIGVEHADDIITDINQALCHVAAVPQERVFA
jgi:methionine-gamma-lyase